MELNENGKQMVQHHIHYKDKDCCNCKHKDEPWTCYDAEPGDVCFDCVASDNMKNWEPLEEST